MIPGTMLLRLHSNIVAAGVAIAGVDINGLVTPTNLQSAAQPTIDSFDASPVAQTAWVAAQLAAALSSQQQAVNNAATNALATNATYIALGSPSAAQVAAQVKALTNQNSVIIQLLQKLNLQGS
jgi:hypothetical protein